jgi:hypothetical protein
MSRNELVKSLNARIKKGDVECITGCLQVITFAGWQQFGYLATPESKVEYAGTGWKGFDIKVLANFAKRTRYRELSVKEVAYSQKRLPDYTAQVAELLAKGIYEDVQAAFAPKS